MKRPPVSIVTVPIDHRMKGRSPSPILVLLLLTVVTILATFSTTFATHTLTGISPSTVPNNVATTFTVTGTGLTSLGDIYFSATGNWCMPFQLPYNITATSFQFQWGPCFPSVPSSSTITIYGSSNFSDLRTIGVTVVAASPPSLTSISPTSTTAPGSALTLTVNGSNFVNPSTVYWNGGSRSTTFVNSTQLTASISAADVATAGTATVTVQNANGTSNGVVFTINNPVPSTSSLSPASTTAPGSSFTLTVNGSNFVSGSTVRWNGSNRTTTYVSSAQLTASIPATDVATAGTATVTVVNASPGGGTSSGRTFTVNNPVPTTTSISPTSTTGPGSAFTLTVTGSNFVTGSGVRWNGGSRPTTYVSSTQLTASIAAGDVQTAGTATVTAFNPSPAGGTSNSQTFTVNNPSPTTTSLSPSSATAGGAGFSLTVNGTNFVGGSTVQWNGSNRTTTYVSATQVTASIPASDLTTGGTATVTVFNGTPGGGTSGGQTFTINYPVPTTSSLSPSSVTAGATTFTLTVNGTGFFSGPSTVRWNGSNRTTTYVSATQVTASIPASDVTTAGTATVTVFNTTPGGGTSGGQTFTINNPVPTTSSLSPSSTTAPGPAFTLTVNGTNFISGASTVQWNGSNRTTTYVSSTQLTASIPASDVSTGGTATVTVFTGTPGGGTSGGQTFTINNPAPAIASLSPTSTNLGGATFTLTVTGSSFVNGSTVQWNGSNRTTTSVSGTQLTASIPASDTTAAGTATVTVTNPTPGGGTSAGQTFTITYPAPTLSSVSPSSTPMASGDLTLTATGTGFYNGVSTVRWNGTALTTTYVSATQLSAVIPAASLAGPDTANLTIFTGGPGGGTSNTKAFTITPTLFIGALQQDGWNVSVAVTWPTAATVTDQVVNCGTTTTQTFTGPSGTCVYTKAGSFTITGTSTVGGTPNVQGPSQTVTIPLLVPTTATLSATVNGLQPAADGTVGPFRFPASISSAITLVRPAGIGIVDALDLNVSRLAITPEGGTASNRFIQTGDDVLHLTASGELTAPATYMLQLNGQTVSGGAISGSLTLVVSQGSPVLILGNLVQDGFNVVMTVSWPDDLQGALPLSINCGTLSTQLLTGSTGVCRYTAAGTFQLRGSFTSPETGAPTLQTALQPVTIPLRVPTGADLAFTVNNVPISGSSITAYRFPAIVRTTVALRLPEQIGVIDPLDLGPSRLNIGRADGSPTAYRLSLGTDLTLSGSLSAFDTAGNYTINLTGQTVHGTAVTASQTLTVTAAGVSLLLGTLVQDGDQVAASVTWPDGVTPIAVNCGTSTLQTFTGQAGACSYRRPGSFQITGTFRNPEDNGSLAAVPATVTVPAITPVNPQLALQVNGQAVTDTSITYRLPSILKAIITLERPEGIGVLDQLDTVQSMVSVSQEGVLPNRYRPVVRDNPLVATADGEFRKLGLHTIAFTGKTLSGQSLAVSATLIIELGKVTLLADEPTQDGNGVAMRVRWPDGIPAGTINCGFASQSLTGPAATCRYTRAGGYQIIGLFLDPARNQTVLTDPIQVTVPLLAPVNPTMSVVSVNSDGVSTDTSGPTPLVFTQQPQSYPVGVKLKVTFDRPEGLGVLDVIDRSRSTLTAMSVTDGAFTPLLLPVTTTTGGPLELTALATLRTFHRDPAQQEQWRYRFTFNGSSVSGATYNADLDLAGFIGGLSPMVLNVSRAAPAVEYPPALYRYTLMSAQSVTRAEPITATWTVTPDGDTGGQTVQNSRMAVTFESPGSYHVRLEVTGPFSGVSTWEDTVMVPELPDTPLPTLLATAPAQNRPPAVYRFKVVTPQMPDRRERLLAPQWTVEGTTATGPIFVTTFTTAGTHEVGVTIPTSYGRTLEATTTVTINPNQSPVGTVDCTRSSYRKVTKTYILYCRATAADPDGRIAGMNWIIPELEYQRPDVTTLLLERTEPAAVTVELHIRDNSGDETVVSVPIDMAQFPTQ